MKTILESYKVANTKVEKAIRRAAEKVGQVTDAPNTVHLQGHVHIRLSQIDKDAFMYWVLKHNSQIKE